MQLFFNHKFYTKYGRIEKITVVALPPSTDIAQYVGTKTSEQLFEITPNNNDGSAMYFYWQYQLMWMDKVTLKAFEVYPGRFYRKIDLFKQKYLHFEQWHMVIHFFLLFNKRQNIIIMIITKVIVFNKPQVNRLKSDWSCQINVFVNHNKIESTWSVGQQLNALFKKILQKLTICCCETLRNFLLMIANISG